MASLQPLPAGFRLEIDPSVRRYSRGRAICGGVPFRALRLTPAGARLAAELLAGRRIADVVDGSLARRLVNAGLAHPIAPAPAERGKLAVVIPVFDRPEGLDRCLTAISGADALSVTVIDDGSTDQASHRRIAEIHDRELIRLPSNAGPAAARNAGAKVATAELIAFVDSDVVVSPSTLESLAAHFADPAVVAAGPRLRPIGPPPGQPTARLDQVARRISPLDLGAAPAMVSPGGLVSHLPAAVLVVRRSAFEAVGGFDESMRVGEDVDLLWRLVDAGGTVRFDPRCVAHHDEPRSWGPWLRRRAAYGASSGPLSLRHPGALAPTVIAPLPLAVAVAAALGRWWLASAAATAYVGVAAVGGRTKKLPLRAGASAAARGLAPTLNANARATVQLAWPVVVAGLFARRSRRAAIMVLLASRSVERCVDDAAYGTGVWLGAARSRTIEPVKPRWRTW